MATRGPFSISPPALAKITWQDMLSITLESGAWVLMPTASLRLQASAGAVNLFRAGLSFTNNERSEIAGADIGRPAASGDQKLEVSLNAYFRLTTRTTVTLRAECSYQGSRAVDPVFDNIYILAIPI